MAAVARFNKLLYNEEKDKIVYQLFNKSVYP